MARIRVKGTVQQEVSRAVVRRINELWRDSVREFVFVFVKEITSRVTQSQKPYVDTGMSIASVVPLASFVGNQLRVGLGQYVEDSIRVAKAIAQASSPTKGTRGGPRGVSKPGKSVAAGRREGTRAFQLQFATPELPQLIFKFELVIDQMLIHNDFFEPALETGRLAFRGYIRSNLKRYLRPSDIKRLILRG